MLKGHLLSLCRCSLVRILCWYRHDWSVLCVRQDILLNSVENIVTSSTSSWYSPASSGNRSFILKIYFLPTRFRLCLIFSPSSFVYGTISPSCPSTEHIGEYPAPTRRHLVTFFSRLTLYMKIELLGSSRSMSSSKDALPSALTSIGRRLDRFLTNCIKTLGSRISTFIKFILHEI